MILCTNIVCMKFFTNKLRCVTCMKIVLYMYTMLVSFVSWHLISDDLDDDVSAWTRWSTY